MKDTYFDNVSINNRKRISIRIDTIRAFKTSRSSQLSWLSRPFFTFPITFAILLIVVFMTPTNISRVADSNIPIIGAYAQREEIKSFNKDLDVFEKELSNDSELNLLNDANSL